MDTLIPNRIETIIENQKFSIESLIIEVAEDINSIKKIIAKIESQGGGILSLLSGVTGIGKTSLAYEASIYLNNKLNNVVNVPISVKYDDILEYITSQTKIRNNKIYPILLDGREAYSSLSELKNFLSGLNSILRRRSDLMILWPTTYDEWKIGIFDLARSIGGKNFVPDVGLIEVKGPGKDQWISILNLILSLNRKSVISLGLSPDEIDRLIQINNSVGEFLADVSNIISERVSGKIKTMSLPELVFVICSSQEVVRVTHDLRSSDFQLDAHRLLRAASESRIARQWRERGAKNDRESLHHILELFRAKICAVSGSALNYACLHGDNLALSDIVLREGIKKSKVNVKNSMKGTDIYKMAVGEKPSYQYTKTKHKMSENGLKAFEKLQMTSTKHDRLLNKSLLDALRSCVNGISYELEKDVLEGNIRVDALVSFGQDTKNFEFHYVSDKNCTAAKVSTYILEKISYYAYEFNIIS